MTMGAELKAGSSALQGREEKLNFPLSTYTNASALRNMPLERLAAELKAAAH